MTFKRWCVVGRGWELRDGDGNVARTLTVMDDFEVLAFYLRFDPRAPR